MRLPLLAVIILAQLVLTAGVAAHDDGKMLRKLTGNGHVLMIRHALAPGFGDPADFSVDDCSTQRNLNEEGRKQARAIGASLRAQGIGQARVYSSQWCRCLETAELLKLGPVTQLPALNSFFELTDTRAANLRELRAFLAAITPEPGPVILVTHHVTIEAITGQVVSSGEGVLVTLAEDGAVASTAVVRFDD